MDPQNYNYHVLGDALLMENIELYAKFVDEVHQQENTPVAPLPEVSMLNWTTM